VLFRSYQSVRDQLGYLHAISAGAAKIDPPTKVTHRRPDYVTNRFIWHCVQNYRDVFGSIPPYTKGTKFQKFLLTVSDEVCRPEAKLRGDLTNRIAASIRRYQRKR